MTLRTPYVLKTKLSEGLVARAGGGLQRPGPYSPSLANSLAQ